MVRWRRNTYDNADQVLLLANLTSAGTTLSSFNYAYNGVGNRTQVVEANGDVVTFGYDPTYQLTNERRSGTNAYNNSYTYDPVGNRTLLLNNGSPTTSTYNAGNELVTSQSSSGVTTSSYDGSGNLLTSLAPGNQRTTNTWDGENRLTQVVLPSGIVDSFTYNGDGQRVQKQDSTGTTKHVWDRQNILQETNASNIIQVVYTLEPLLYGNLISQSRGGTDSFYLFDALASTRQLASSAGSVTDSYLYDSFGDVLLSSGSTVNWFRYVGRSGYYFDTDPVKYYVRTRTYDPLTARWLSRVVMTREGFRSTDVLNIYNYSRNNPLQSDPAGLDPPARPKPDPPNWFPGWWWGYGWYCGGSRKGPPPIEPIDPLDAACKRHDNCLGTPWLFLKPCRQAECNLYLCNSAVAAEDGGCAEKYLQNRRLDLSGNPVMDWRGYYDCMRAASEIQMFYCATLPQWWWNRVLPSWGA